MTTKTSNDIKSDPLKLSTKSEDGDCDDAATAAETPLSSPERESPASPPSITAKAKENVKVEDGDGDAVAPEAILSKIVKKESSDEDYSNWPLHAIKDPHPNDVLYGRGGGTNHHPGNKRYRKLVEGRKVDYVNSKRLDKPLVALEIIKGWRSQTPPGRFLKINEKTGLWHDVGDKKAREKTSQALREKAPLLRKQQEEQKKEKETKEKMFKNTRFDVPEKSGKANKNVSRLMLARDHSLGRDYISPDDSVSVKGFSWTAPALETTVEDIPKSASWGNNRDQVPYAVRGSGTSVPHAPNHMPHPDPYVSSSQYPAPHPQEPPHIAGFSGDWTTQYPHNPHTPVPHTTNSGMYEWRGSHSDGASTKSYGDNESNYLQTRSADDGYRRHRDGYYHQDNNPSSRSQVESNDYERFASIVGTDSGYNMLNWTSMNSQQTHNSEVMYDSASYCSPDRMQSHSHDSFGHAQSWTSPRTDPTSPQSSVDYYNPSAYRSKPDTLVPSPYHNIPSPGSREDIPRPPNVKRDTSNKLRTMDVEPTKKRMNRQSSMSSVGEITENDMSHLKDSLAQSTLERPKSLTSKQRVRTIDRIVVDLEGASSPLDRQTTRERRGSEGSISLDGVIAKPSPLTDGDRISTIDTIDIDSAFLGELTNAAPV